MSNVKVNLRRAQRWTDEKTGVTTEVGSGEQTIPLGMAEYLVKNGLLSKDVLPKPSQAKLEKAEATKAKDA
jgi:hypothetical protein